MIPGDNVNSQIIYEECKKNAIFACITIMPQFNNLKI